MRPSGKPNLPKLGQPAFTRRGGGTSCATAVWAVRRTTCAYPAMKWRRLLARRVNAWTHAGFCESLSPGRATEATAIGLAQFSRDAPGRARLLPSCDVFAARAWVTFQSSHLTHRWSPHYMPPALARRVATSAHRVCQACFSSSGSFSSAPSSRTLARSMPLCQRANVVAIAARWSGLAVSSR